jgi:hypothetical protein
MVSLCTWDRHAQTKVPPLTWQSSATPRSLCFLVKVRAPELFTRICRALPDLLYSSAKALHSRLCRCSTQSLLRLACWHAWLQPLSMYTVHAQELSSHPTACPARAGSVGCLLALVHMPSMLEPLLMKHTMIAEITQTEPGLLNPKLHLIESGLAMSSGGPSTTSAFGNLALQASAAYTFLWALLGRAARLIRL